MSDPRLFFGAIALAVVCAVWAIGSQRIGHSGDRRKGSPLDDRPPRKGEQ